MLIVEKQTIGKKGEIINAEDKSQISFSRHMKSRQMNAFDLFCSIPCASEDKCVPKEEFWTKQHSHNVNLLFYRWHFILTILIFHFFRQEASCEETSRIILESVRNFESFSDYPPLGNITGGASARTMPTKSTRSSTILNECDEENSISGDSVTENRNDYLETKGMESTLSRPPPSLPEYETHELSSAYTEGVSFDVQRSVHVNQPGSVFKYKGGEANFTEHEEVNGHNQNYYDLPQSIGRRIFRRLYPVPLRTKIAELEPPSNKNDAKYDQNKEKEYNNFETRRKTESLTEEKRTNARPVVYRYFGRSSSRRRSYSIPFILLGSNVDQWKEAGRVLASRGFNVIACEWSTDEKVDGSMKWQQKLSTGDRSIGEEGEGLVLAVLDALRWERAVIVGCDSSAVSAMEAARNLAPERVAGLIMCGDLTDADKYLKTIRAIAEKTEKSALAERYSSSWNYPSSSRTSPLDDFRSIDSYMQNRISCPSIIIWNGDITTSKTLSSQSNDVKLISPDLRSIILGGGNAPHRRLPEQFAWVLTRFVEEKVALVEGKTAMDLSRDDSDSSPTDKSVDNFSIFPLWNNALLRQVCSVESALVSGNAAANAIVYIIACHVALYQCKNVLKCITFLRYNCVRLSLWKRKGLQFINEIILYGLQRKILILRCFRKRSDNDGISSFKNITDEETK